MVFRNEPSARAVLFNQIVSCVDFQSMTRGRLCELTGNCDVTPADLVAGKSFMLSTSELVHLAQQLNVPCAKALEQYL